MQLNLKALSKKAIDAALKKDWETAIQVNEQILEKEPGNKDAQVRLGRAYIATEKFAKAKKIFKQVLEADPINQIAQKNYQLASEKADIRGGEELTKSTKALIKEPGTTTQILLNTNKKTADKFEPGEKIDLKINKNKLIFSDKDSKKVVGFIEDENAKIVYKAHTEKKEITASVSKTNSDHIMILLKCKSPIFKSEKQMEKPYMKKGLIEEPEIEIPELEETPEE